ncbi:hypothetical protein C8J44_1297 [Sphingomonas sp. PP-CE-3A-406]|nr:hypothetical protein C8J44_1297 [Sphingomonas sp. PP-CE-3A-406]
MLPVEGDVFEAINQIDVTPLPKCVGWYAALIVLKQRNAPFLLAASSASHAWIQTEAPQAVHLVSNRICSRPDRGSRTRSTLKLIVVLQRSEHLVHQTLVFPSRLLLCAFIVIPPGTRHVAPEIAAVDLDFQKRDKRPHRSGVDFNEAPCSIIWLVLNADAQSHCELRDGNTRSDPNSVKNERGCLVFERQHIRVPRHDPRESSLAAWANVSYRRFGGSLLISRIKST